MKMYSKIYFMIIGNKEFVHVQIMSGILLNTS